MEYNVVISDATQQLLQTLLGEARVHGQDRELKAAMAYVLQKLKETPHTTGELKYHLPSGRPVHYVVRAPLAVWFAIYDPERVVWVHHLSQPSAPGE